MPIEDVTYHEALQIIESHALKFQVSTISLDLAGGQFLAENLVADRDFPPYDRATMDGIAICYDSFVNGNRSFAIEAISPAGHKPLTLKSPYNCVEVMTGAMVPYGTDTVIPYEDLDIKNNVAQVVVENVNVKQNIHFQGTDITEGKVIVPAGQRISSAEVNVAAAIGKDLVEVYKLPPTVVVSTGDELVDINMKPEAYLVRRSNVYGIYNTLMKWGIRPDLMHIPDEKRQMQKVIGDLIENYQLLIFSGGVSKGKYDYLPEVLEDLGVNAHFHRVQQRPGKPLWYGSTSRGGSIFALPGNPVSSFVCLYTYVRFWLLRSLGIVPRSLYAQLTDDVYFKPNLMYFLEAVLMNKDDGGLYARPLLGNGSGDFINLVQADGFLMLPQEKSAFLKGEIYPFIKYRDLM